MGGRGKAEVGTVMGQVVVGREHAPKAVSQAKVQGVAEETEMVEETSELGAAAMGREVAAEAELPTAVREKGTELVGAETGLDAVEIERESAAKLEAEAR